MLYDDSEQVEVRHVISLAHHTIDIHGGGEPLGEGDLWIKRNCLRLTRKPTASNVTPTSKPFYFFSDNCSEKEDFYHTLLLYQSESADADAPPLPKPFDTQHIIKLVQQLHGPDSDNQSRWLNALIGRVFLALYKTDDIENFIRAKINRKISRVPKPNFITSIQIQDIDMGDSGPIISNPRLKEMNVNGDTTVEMDVKYNGCFKLQMGAVARIDLGSRLKAREVNLVMAGTLRKLSGHVLIRIKPPPSNRFWIAFETMPHIEMSIEPIVSSRQITYGVILRAIESRIREVIGETLVLPNWDDSPFLDTSRKKFRGGIFEANATTDYTAKSKAKEAEDHALETAINELANVTHHDTEDPGPSSLKETHHKTMSMPSLLDPPQKASLRKAAKRSAATLAEETSAITTGTSLPSSPASTPASPPLPVRKPKTMRSNSFASAATPLVSTEGANVEAIRPGSRSKRHSKGAMDLVKEVRSRNQSSVSSPTPSEADTGHDDIPPLSMDPSSLAEALDEDVQDEIVKRLNETNLDQSDTLRRFSEPPTPETADPGYSTPRSPSTSSIPTSTNKSPSRASSGKSSTQLAPSPSHLSTAANAAKKWGLNVLNRQATNASSSTASGPFSFPKSGRNSTNTSLNSTASSSSLPAQQIVPPPHPETLRAGRGEPMGRGQPLPPPGVPLPGPPGQKSLWGTSALNLGMGGLKRKPVPGPALPPRKSDQQQKHQQKERPKPPPLPARRPITGQDDGDSMLVVAAPEEDGSSLPVSPVSESLVNDDAPALRVDGKIDDAETAIGSSADQVDLPDYGRSSQDEWYAESVGLGIDNAVPAGMESKSTETIKGEGLVPEHDTGDLTAEQQHTGTGKEDGEGMMNESLMPRGGVKSQDHRYQASVKEENEEEEQG